MNLIIQTDPFRPHLNSQVTKIEEITTINEILVELGYLRQTPDGLKRTGAFLVRLNNEPVLQADWNTVVGEDDILVVSALPKGGGSGNIFAAILIAVLAFFTFGLSLVAAAAVGIAAYAGLTLLGSMVPSPSVGNLSRENSSPTYSLNAQGNNARLLEAIPRVYGRVRVYPDLASQPYAEYENNEQILYQLFCVSLGDVDIEDIFVDETSIELFSDATYQIVKPGQAVTLFPDNVVTSDSVSNIEMTDVFSATYVLNPSGTKATQIAVDLGLPRGAGTIDKKGNTQPFSVGFVFQVQAIDDDGNPLGDWQTLVNSAVRYATTQPQTVTFKANVAEARYQIRGRRAGPASTDNRTFDQLNWLAARAYLPSIHVFPMATVIAVKMKATNVLNSTTARKFSVVAKGKVQTWDPVNGWGALVFDANPAWIAADILRNTSYGRGLPTERLNMAELYRLSLVWKERGDEFNGVFDTTSQLWDALSKVCRVGRATPIYYAAVIDFVRDEPKTIPNAMFQPSNMVAGSFKTVYNFFDFDAPDHVVIEYLNRNTWQSDTVVCALPGSPKQKPYNVELFGCTDRDQAWREGMSMAAANRDRRRTISFTVTTPGFVPYYNSLARIAHDVPQWGYFGRVLSLDPATGVLRTSEPITFETTEQHVIAFRKRDGSEDGPYIITKDPDADANQNIFGCIVSGSPSTLADIYISDGVREDYTFYQCGPTERRGILALITKAAPTDDGKVNLTCINYADSVHSAENGGVVPPPGPASNLPNLNGMPIVSTVEVVYTFQVGVQNIIASPANGAIYYEFQARPGSDASWQNLGTNQDPTLTVNLSPGPWEVRVRGVAKVAGPWCTWIGQIEASTLPVPTLSDFSFTPELQAIGLAWAYNPESEAIASAVEIYVSASNVIGNSIKLTEQPYPITSFAHSGLGHNQTLFYWIRAIDEAGRIGPWFNNGIGLQAHSVDNANEILEALKGQLTETQLGQTLLDKFNTDDATVEIQTIKDNLNALWTIKTQLTVNGLPYIAGIGVGVETDNNGDPISQVVIAASQFIIIDPNTEEKGVPFAVQGGQTVLRGLIAASGTFSGDLEASGGTFNGELVAATGTFAGILQAGTVDLTKLVGTTQTFTVPGTYVLTVPAGFTSMRATVQAAGAGGGGGAQWNGGGNAGGGGGGGGGYAIGTFSGMTPGNTVTLVVGAPGAGGGEPGGTGSNGGATSISGYISVNGGTGGQGGSVIYKYQRGVGGSGGSGAVQNGGGGGGGGEPGGNGYLAQPGNGGAPNGGTAGSMPGSVSGANIGGGGGGGSRLGRGGNGGTLGHTYGYPGSGYGAGGGGGCGRNAYNNQSNYAGSRAAGSGSGGYAVVEFYNPNGVVIRSEWNTLISALQRQGIATV